MNNATLQGMRVAILIADGFQETELLEPKWALDHAGAAMFVISPAHDRVKGWTERNGEKQIAVDIPLKSAKPQDFHALLLPGGSTNIDQLRTNPQALQFVKHFAQAEKPVATIGEASLLLLDLGALRGYTVTSAPSLKSDFENAGAKWSDTGVACDRNLITSRNPEDAPEFSREIIRLFAEVREHSTHMRKIY
jgi:protease I